MKKGLSVIIPCWNGKHLLQQNLPSALEALKRLDMESELIVVDDASTDGVSEMLEKDFPSVRVMRHTQNQGFGGGIHTGVAAAQFSILYFLNSDVRLEPDAFEKVVRHFDQEDVFAVASLDKARKPLVLPAYTNRGGLLGVTYVEVDEPNQAIEIPFASGGHSAYSTEKFRELGGYDELYKPIYWEDIDICARAQVNRWRILLDPESQVHHDVGSTMGRRHSNPRIESFRSGHRFLFTLRHSPNLSFATFVSFFATYGVHSFRSLWRILPRWNQLKRNTVRVETVLRNHSVAAVKARHGKPLRVAFVSSTNDIIGGGEHSLLTLLRSLDRKRVEPILFAPAKGTLTRAAEDLGVAVATRPMPTVVQGLLDTTLLRWARAFRKHRIDLVHVNSAGRALMLAGWAAKGFGIPVIWHMRVATKEFVDGLQASLSDRVIATSSFVASRLQQDAACSKIVKIPNPVDLERFKPQQEGDGWRKTAGIDEQIPLVGVIGRLDAWKRFELAIDTLAVVNESIPVQMAILGDGPERNALERRAREKGIQDRVSFLGWQDQPELALAAMDLLLHPTPKEHFGRIFIEAMAAGRPVVSVRSGGAAELVLDGETGMLAEPDDVAGLAERIKQLIQDEGLRSSMGQRARELAEELYSGKSVSGRVVELYDEVCGVSYHG